MARPGVCQIASEQYIFTDRSARSARSYEDVSHYENDPTLGADIDATVLVKWDNQREHDENLRHLGRLGWDVAKGNALAPSPRNRHRYFGGLIVRTTFDCDILSAATAEVQPALQPTGVDALSDGQTVYACGNRLLLSPDGDISNVSATIENPMFARLHSVAFSNDGKRALTASSSLDMLYEVELSNGEVAWSMDLWSETPYNKNIFGQSFYRSPNGVTDYILNPSSFDLKDNEQLRGAHCVINDPTAYKGLGLATALAPVFINAVDYESNDILLATSFGRGEAWRINRTSQEIEVVARGLGRPHGLHVDSATGGYLVSDTLKEQVLLLDKDFEHEHVLDLSTLAERKEGLEDSRWLQYTTELRPGLYCAAMTSRQKLTLFDPTNKVRRDIPIDPNWGIQMVVANS